MSYKKRKTSRIKVKRSDDKVSESAERGKKSKNIAMKRSVSPSRKLNREKTRGEKPTDDGARYIHVIEGSKLKNEKRRRRSLIAAAVVAVLIAAVLAVNTILPTGLVEWSQNLFSAMGSGGGLPVQVSGDKVDDLRGRGGELFVMSDSYMYAYNSSGKQITSVQHGYSSPRLEVSSTRTLIYDRGSYGLRVDALYTNFIDTQLNNKIITADICDRGYVAVATDSSDYSAEVTVYSDKFKSLFRWSAASGQVTSLKLSPRGKYLAASVVSGKNGDYCSEISIFDIQTGARVFTKEYAGSMFVKSYADKNCVTFVGIDSTVSFKWDGTGERSNDFYRLEYFDGSDPENMVAVYHPDGDDRRFTVAVIGTDGASKGSFTVDGDAGKVCADSENVYTYYNGVINKYDFSGSKLDSFSTGCEYVYIAAYKNGVAATHDMKLDFYS